VEFGTPMELPGEELSLEEIAKLDPPSTPEQEAVFQQDLARIEAAERAALADDNIFLGTAAEQIEYNHFSAGSAEVTGPPPPFYEGSSQTFGTFAAPPLEVPQWRKDLVQKRLAEKAIEISNREN
jgi:hypothetical protein